MNLVLLFYGYKAEIAQKLYWKMPPNLPQKLVLEGNFWTNME